MANKEKGAVEAALPGELEDGLAAEPSLDRAVQTRIGDHLRAMYDELLRQPVPDKLKSLIERLDKDSDPS